MDDPSAELLARWRAGESGVADELFGRYTERLIALARRQLSAKLSRRVDPEDIVQSAYRCFCAGAREGRFTLHRSGDLWRLLAAITLNRLHHQVDRHTAARRAVGREQAFAGESSLQALGAGAASREPTPEEAAILAEELEGVQAGLSPSHRLMVELRLQGYRIEEVADAVGRSERMVRMVLDGVKGRLEARSREASEARPLGR